MDTLALLLMAVGLSMDVFVVSIASGLSVKGSRLGLAAKLATLFGFFHIIMVLLGWLLGTGLRDLITNFDHWIAFGLLLVIGIKMIMETFESQEKLKSSNFLVLIALAVATSIDALAVGVSFAFLDTAIISAAVIIGCTAAIFSFIGVFAGHKGRDVFGRWPDLFGGLILIGIGVKILFEHIF